MTRPRVLILGGGFAGVGAAQKLKDADADVVLVDRHDYHTFQPLLYQLATGLLETTGVGHSLRDLLERHENTTIHKDTVTAVDLDARQVSFDELAPISYDYLVFGLGAQVNFFGTEGAPEHAFPMYTLPHAVRLKDHLLERWEAADRDPSIIADGALNVVVVGGGPTGVETAGALAELYRGNFARDYREREPQTTRAITLVEAGPELFSMFKPKLREYATKALADRTVEVKTGTAVASVAPTRVTLKSGEELKAHTLVWGAGLQGNELVHSARRRARSAGTASPSGRTSPWRTTPRCTSSATSPRSRTRRRGRSSPSSGRSPSSRASTPARRSPGASPARSSKPFAYKDKGTMATIGRGAAVVQFLGGKTMTGVKAQLAWGTVHLALLPTNEDRAKAVVDWAGAAMTHQRAGRITVEED